MFRVLSDIIFCFIGRRLARSLVTFRTAALFIAFASCRVAFAVSSTFGTARLLRGTASTATSLVAFAVVFAIVFARWASHVSANK